MTLGRSPSEPAHSAHASRGQNSSRLLSSLVSGLFPPSVQDRHSFKAFPDPDVTVKLCLGRLFRHRPSKSAMRLLLTLLVLLDSAAVWRECESLAGRGKDGEASHVGMVARRSVSLSLPLGCTRSQRGRGQANNARRCKIHRRGQERCTVCSTWRNFAEPHMHEPEPPIRSASSFSP